MDNLNFLKRTLNLVLAFSLLTSASMVMADTDSHDTHFGTIDAINGDFGFETGFVAGSLDDVDDNDWVTFDAVDGETVELLLSNTDDDQFLNFAIFRDENDNGVIEVGDVANVTNFNSDQTGAGTDIVVQHAGFNSGSYAVDAGETVPFAFVAPVTGQYVVGVASTNAAQALDYEIELVVTSSSGDDSRATFPVDKDFDDDNPAEVQVTISCNTGLPLEQSDDISEGDGVVFVVTDFNDGELDCEVFEDPVPAGYLPEYFANRQAAGAESCTFENVTFGSENRCSIVDTLQAVTVEVTKEWIDENPQFNPVNFARAEYSCEDAQGTDPSGSLTFSDNDSNFEETRSFTVLPHWNGDTTCDVDENVVESGIEADDSDCQNLSVTPGNGASCTIVNTRLFEGIPTLSQYGLGLLALLMLGMGFVAFRRMS